MTALESAGTAKAERRWAIIGVVVVLVALVAQAVAGVIREAVIDEPSFLEKVETCLVERSTPFERVVDDPVARSAARGALRTTVQGNAVTVALGGSEDDARRVYDAYAAVASEEVARTRLERSRKVVFLWDAPPSQAQHDFMVLCTLDAQE